MIRKTKKFVLILCTAICLIASGCTGQNENKTTDSKETSNKGNITIEHKVESGNYSITYDKVPERAVSLSSFTTEMMLALGLENKMVGTAYQDNEILPEFKKAYESIESLSEANVSREKMIATKPDFLTGWLSDFKDKNHNPQFCEENGIKMYVPVSEYSNITMESVYKDFENLGKIFKVEDRANKVINYMKDNITKVNEKLPKGTDPKKVFIYESGADAPYTPITALPNAIVKAAGGVNIFGDGEKSWSTVNWEDVVAKNPEFIIIMKYDSHDDYKEKMDVLKNNKSLANVTAIKNNNIIEIPAADLLPGVRNVRAIENIAKNLYPEDFK